MLLSIRDDVGKESIGRSLEKEASRDLELISSAGWDSFWRSCAGATANTDDSNSATS
jgi:hypothetical protein